MSDTRAPTTTPPALSIAATSPPVSGTPPLPTLATNVIHTVRLISSYVRFLYVMEPPAAMRIGNNTNNMSSREQHRHNLLSGASNGGVNQQRQQQRQPEVEILASLEEAVANDRQRVDRLQQKYVRDQKKRLSSTAAAAGSSRAKKSDGGKGAAGVNAAAAAVAPPVEAPAALIVEDALGMLAFFDDNLSSPTRRSIWEKVWRIDSPVYSFALTQNLTSPASTSPSSSSSCISAPELSVALEHVYSAGLQILEDHVEVISETQRKQEETQVAHQAARLMRAEAKKLKVRNNRQQKKKEHAEQKKIKKHNSADVHRAAGESGVALTSSDSSSDDDEDEEQQQYSPLSLPSGPSPRLPPGITAVDSMVIAALLRPHIATADTLVVGLFGSSGGNNAAQQQQQMKVAPEQPPMKRGTTTVSHKKGVVAGGGRKVAVASPPPPPPSPQMQQLQANLLQAKLRGVKRNRDDHEDTSKNNVDDGRAGLQTGVVIRELLKNPFTRLGAEVAACCPPTETSLAQHDDNDVIIGGGALARQKLSCRGRVRVFVTERAKQLEARQREYAELEKSKREQLLRRTEEQLVLKEERRFQRLKLQEERRRLATSAALEEEEDEPSDGGRERQGGEEALSSVTSTKKRNQPPVPTPSIHAHQSPLTAPRVLDINPPSTTVPPPPLAVDVALSVPPPPAPRHRRLSLGRQNKNGVPQLSTTCFPPHRNHQEALTEPKDGSGWDADEDEAEARHQQEVMEVLNLLHHHTDNTVNRYRDDTIYCTIQAPAVSFVVSSSTQHAVGGTISELCDCSAGDYAMGSGDGSSEVHVLNHCDKTLFSFQLPGSTTYDATLASSSSCREKSTAIIGGEGAIKKSDVGFWVVGNEGCEEQQNITAT